MPRRVVIDARVMRPICTGRVIRRIAFIAVIIMDRFGAATRPARCVHQGQLDVEDRRRRTYCTVRTVSMKRLPHCRSFVVGLPGPPNCRLFSRRCAAAGIVHGGVKNRQVVFRLATAISSHTAKSRKYTAAHATVQEDGPREVGNM